MGFMVGTKVKCVRGTNAGKRGVVVRSGHLIDVRTNKNQLLRNLFDNQWESRHESGLFLTRVW